MLAVLLDTLDGMLVHRNSSWASGVGGGGGGGTTTHQTTQSPCYNNLAVQLNGSEKKLK